MPSGWITIISAFIWIVCNFIISNSFVMLGFANYVSHGWLLVVFFSKVLWCCSFGVHLLWWHNCLIKIWEMWNCIGLVKHLFWCSDSLLLKPACFEKNLAFTSATQTKTRCGMSCYGFYVDEMWNVLISMIFSFLKDLNFAYVTNRENRSE